MRSEIIAHFTKVDPTLAAHLSKTGTVILKQSETYFIDLVESIIGQQLSEKAGATILSRFYALVPRHTLTPETMLTIPDNHIRAVGTSWSKVQYLKNIAHAFINKTIDVAALPTWSDSEVIAHLTQVKGVGKWTAEMFLMFSLGREDIFSHGDVGLQNGILKVYGYKKLPSKKKLSKLTQKWSPYRTYACRILWSVLDNK